MENLNTITRFLNKELKIRSIKDTSKNGLQVKGKTQVTKIGFAVDGCIEVFEKAKKAKCDLIVVHHGILWKGLKDPLKNTAKRKAFLQKNKMSLYGVHLPLDKHEKYGNNIELANILGLNKIKKFGRYHGTSIGYSGSLSKAMSPAQTAAILNREIKTKSKILSFGKKKVKTVGIVSGGGALALTEAIKSRLDLFITGEAPLHTYHTTKEAKMNMIIAGHYATETTGVKALMKLLKQKFNIQTIFIDIPTGM